MKKNQHALLGKEIPAEIVKANEWSRKFYLRNRLLANKARLRFAFFDLYGDTPMGDCCALFVKELRTQSAVDRVLSRVKLTSIYDVRYLRDWGGNSFEEVEEDYEYGYTHILFKNKYLVKQY